MPSKSTAQDVLDAANKFVAKQKGDWDHAGWESFLAEVEKKGVQTSDEARRHLGNLLESLKYFYGVSPAAAATPKTKAKEKAKAKPKASAKPKAKAKPKA